MKNLLYKFINWLRSLSKKEEEVKELIIIPNPNPLLEYSKVTTSFTSTVPLLYYLGLIDDALTEEDMVFANSAVDISLENRKEQTLLDLLKDTTLEDFVLELKKRSISIEKKSKETDNGYMRRNYKLAISVIGDFKHIMDSFSFNYS